MVATPTAAQATSGVASPAPTPVAGAVFLIVMENRSYAEALSGAYTASLASRYALLTDYRGVAHPSLPNYLALTSGSTWGITDDGYHRLPAGRDLGAELTAAGVPWRAYMQGMSAGRCLDSGYPYALKHDPFAYYGGACPPNVVPFGDLGQDLQAGRERFTWITPDLCSDGHDCSTAKADAWLAAAVPPILASPGWRAGGALFITWDEDDGSVSNRVATLVVAPNLRAHRDGRALDHYALLAAISRRLGVKPPGAASTAVDLLRGGVFN